MNACWLIATHDWRNSSAVRIKLSVLLIQPYKKGRGEYHLVFFSVFFTAESMIAPLDVEMARPGYPAYRVCERDSDSYR